MFRHLCLLAVAFLAVSDATKNHTATHIKDTKPSHDNGNKKTKTATFCVDVSYDSVVNPQVGGFLAVTQGPLFDCDVQAPTEDDYFGILSLSCGGMINTITTLGDLLCSGIITVNTEGNKYAKQDFSSVAFTALSPVDISARRQLYSVDVGDFTGLVITGSNGAWGKSDNIKDISYTALGKDIYEVGVTYKTKGFNPVPV